MSHISKFIFFPAILFSFFAYSVSFDDLYNQVEKEAKHREEWNKKNDLAYEQRIKRVVSGCSPNMRLSYQAKSTVAEIFSVNPDKVYLSRFEKGGHYCELFIHHPKGVCNILAQDIVDNSVYISSYAYCGG